MEHARVVLDYWFGKLPLSPRVLEERMEFWFGSEDQAARDRAIAARFRPLTERAAAGTLASWADSPRRRLALILLLDQFPRNIHRGTARAFAADREALSLTLSGMQLGADAALDPVERLFFYMPLEHAESPEVQEESLTAFRRLLAESPAALHATFAQALRFAQMHHAIVARFGRFPYRNTVLGRPSTPEELAWLRDGSPRFGQ